MAVHIVPLEPLHWNRVREIYLEGLVTGQAGFETRAPGWHAWDDAHLKHSRLVARDDLSNLLGWVALSRVSPRQCYAGVAEVSIYVAGQSRGQGVGRQLMSAVIQTSEAAGIWTLQAVVFPENEASVRLHERAGFRVVGRRERIAQRDGIWHDTLLLERRSPVVGRIGG